MDKMSRCASFFTQTCVCAIRSRSLSSFCLLALLAFCRSPFGLLTEFSYGKLARVFVKAAKTRVIFLQRPRKIAIDNRTLLDKYKFGAKNSLSGINKMQSEVSDGFTATDKAQSETSDGFTAFNKMPSEASAGFTAFNKALSEASDTSTAFNKTLSEVSDGFTAFNKMLSEVSDTPTAFNKMPSETSDGFTETNKMPSETSDGFTAFNKVLSEPSDAFSSCVEYCDDCVCSVNNSRVLGRQPQAVLGKVGGLEGENPRFRVEGLSPSKFKFLRFQAE